jgi:cell shape-determining protein MreD
MSRNPFVAFVMILLGVILLLPGLCALYFFVGSSGPGDPSILLLWLVCFGISAGGVALIISAFRGPRR